MSSAITTYTGTLSAQERAELLWGLPTLPPREQARHDRLIQAIRRLASHEPMPMPRREPRYLTEPTYWRNRAAAEIHTACTFCGGTGEVPEMGIDGEYEGYIPCWVCNPVLPDLPFDDNDTPF